MTRQVQIRLNEILLAREAAFARIAAIEAEIHAIVGQAYPFPPPPDLPSRQKPKKPPRTKAEAPPKPPRLERLASSGHAYRVHYLDEGVATVETHFEPGPIERLLALAPRSLRVTRIEVIDAEGTVLRTTDL